MQHIFFILIFIDLSLTSLDDRKQLFRQSGRCPALWTAVIRSVNKYFLSV